MDENESNLSVHLKNLSNAPIAHNATNETNLREMLNSFDSNVEE